MKITAKRKASMYKYAQENLKRIPLDVPKVLYEQIKIAAMDNGESVNGYIKKAIISRMKQEGRTVYSVQKSIGAPQGLVEKIIQREQQSNKEDTKKAQIL